MYQTKFIFVCAAVIICFTIGRTNGADSVSEFPHRIVMDSERKYILLWTYNETHIIFEAQVETLGYIGFGISPDGRMRGSDMVIGWVTGDRSYFQDRYGLFDDQEPRVDKRQDWHLQMSFKNDTHTVLRFDRKFDTCDEEDLPITTDTMRLLYSYHPDIPQSVNNLPYHGETRRGYRSVVLIGGTSNVTAFPPDTRSFELRMPDITINYQNRDSVYMCKTFRLPRFFTKTHIIAFEPALQMDNEAIVQQIIMYRCYGQQSVFDDVSIFNGRICSKVNLVEKLCMQPFAFWSRKNEGFYLPNNVGFPVDGGQQVFVMIQILYRNVYSKTSYTDNSGLKFFYTQNLRPFDAGFSKVSAFETGIDLLLPPRQAEIRRQAICNNDCTTLMLPPDGVIVFAMCPHTHSLGRRITVKHIRGNQELPEFMQDNGYDPEYQTCHLLNNPRRLLQGDQIIVECYYDTGRRVQVTRGGVDSANEACTVFFMFYPNYNFISCNSGPAPTTTLQALSATDSGLIPGTNIIRTNGVNRTLIDYALTLNWDNQRSYTYQNTILSGPVHYACFALNDRGLLVARQEIEAAIQYIPRIIPLTDRNRCGYSIRAFGGPANPISAEARMVSDYFFYNNANHVLSFPHLIVLQLLCTLLLLRF